MPPSLPAPTLSDQSGLWACGQREDALPTGPTGATTGDYMIEKCQPCNRSTLSAMYPVEPESDLSPHAGRGGTKRHANHLTSPPGQLDSGCATCAHLSPRAGRGSTCERSPCEAKQVG